MNLLVPKERNLFLTGTVDQLSLKTITEKIVDISENDILIADVYKSHGLVYNPKPIKLFIDSYGGQLYPCLGLIGVIENSKTEVHTIVTGCAMSAGFLISIAGKKRFAYKTSHLLYHQLSSGTFGELATMEQDIQQKKKLQHILQTHVLRRTKISKKELQESYKTKTDKYYSASEALSKGMIDEIL